MKRVVVILVLACSVAACNDSADDKAAGTDPGATIMDADSVRKIDSIKRSEPPQQLSPLDTLGRKPRN